MAIFNRAALSFLVIVLCVAISRTNQQESVSIDGAPRLQYDYYRHSCPSAEKIIRLKTKELYELNPTVAPAMLRLVFHDCFVQGCDASVLLDTTGGGKPTEKEGVPNSRVKGFDVIDTIKSHLEETCPGVVSCADIIVLAARESVMLAGGPFYPLFTGRRDSLVSLAENANKLPAPHHNLEMILALFHAKGFDEQGTVSLLGGGHSVGDIHCKFFMNRLNNFTGSGEPDSTMNAEFVEELRAKCNSTNKQKADDDFGEPMKMDYEGRGSSFGSIYYRSLLQGRGMLFSDQQLMAIETTAIWVQAYASDISLFQRDFATAMFRLSNLDVLTAPSGQIRLNCSRKN